MKYPTLTKYVPPLSKTNDPDFVLDSSDDESIDDIKELGRPVEKLNLDSKSNQKFKALTKQIRELILALCEKEDVDLGRTIAKVGSMMLHGGTNPKHYNYKQAMVFTKIAKGDDDIYQGAEFSDDDSLYLFSSLEIGRDRYTDLKQFCGKHKVQLPCYNNVKKRKIAYVPIEDLYDCFERGTIQLNFSQQSLCI